MWFPYSGLSAPCFGAAIVNDMVGLFQGQQRIIHCTVSILLIFFFLGYLLCVSALTACMFVLCVRLVSVEVRRGYGIPWDWCYR